MKKIICAAAIFGMLVSPAMATGRHPQRQHRANPPPYTYDYDYRYQYQPPSNYEEYMRTPPPGYGPGQD